MSAGLDGSITTEGSLCEPVEHAERPFDWDIDCREEFVPAIFIDGYEPQVEAPVEDVPYMPQHLKASVPEPTDDCDKAIRGALTNAAVTSLLTGALLLGTEAAAETHNHNPAILVTIVGFFATAGICQVIVGEMSRQQR